VVLLVSEFFIFPLYEGSEVAFPLIVSMESTVGTLDLWRFIKSI